MRKQLTYFKRSFIYSNILAAAFFIISCSNNDTITNQGGGTPVDTSAFILQLGIGSQWNYESISTVSDIHPDSIRHYFTNYPLTGRGTLTSEKDTVMNGVTTRLLVNNYHQDSTVYVSRMYYLKTDTALMHFAYSLHSSSDIFPRPGNHIYYNAGGRTFRSIRELTFSIMNSATRNLNDTTIFENPPPETMKYPIVTNKQWVFRHFGSNLLLKKYLNFENLVVGTQQISCIKTQFTWSTANDFVVYYHYSKSGLMKYDLKGDDFTISNEFGQILGTFDLRELTYVTSFIIAGE